MPADTVDPELIVDAILMHVQDQGDLGPDWLMTEHKRVLAAVMEGDEFITSTSFQGQSSAAERQVSAKWLLAILTQARRRLPNADGIVDDSRAPAMLIPRFSDHPLN
jgi:hypothetical protein